MAVLWAAVLLLSMIGGTQSQCITAAASAWGPWSDWSPCSVSCGGGSRTRTRVCTEDPCVGEATETGHCNYLPCPPTVCDDDPVTEEPEWKLTTVNITTTSSDIMIGTVDAKGHKLGLCWLFVEQSVSVVSPPCNRLRVGTAEGGTPTAQLLGEDCTYEVPASQDVDINVQDDAGGSCAVTTYEAAGDCPVDDVVEIEFFSQKTDVGVLLNVEPEDEEVSFLVGLLGNSSTLSHVGLQRYNACIRAVPGTPWRAVLYENNNKRVLINGQCSYITTDDPHQIVTVGPVCGGWGDWGPWEECMLTEDGWKQIRRRPCDNPPPQNDGWCAGDQYEYRTCVCAAPTLPPSMTTGDLQTSYNWGDTVEVCCIEGYVSELTGRSSFTVSCNFYNRWETFQTCIRLECPTPVFPNGVVTGGVAPYYSGSQVTVRCNDGYSNIFGEQTFTSECTGTTWWPSTCVAIYCDPLPSITYGLLSVSPGVTSYQPGDTVGVTCQEGYTLSPGTVLTCDDDGHWTPDITCAATTCPNKIDLFKYNIGSSMLGQPGTPVYNVAFLTCKHGYTAGGKDSYTSTCLPDGTWSNLQQCQPSDDSTLVMDSASIGLVSALAVVVVLITVFAFIRWCPGFFGPRLIPIPGIKPVPPVIRIPPAGWVHPPVARPEITIPPPRPIPVPKPRAPAPPPLLIPIPQPLLIPQPLPIPEPIPLPIQNVGVNTVYRVQSPEPMPPAILQLPPIALPPGGQVLLPAPDQYEGGNTVFQAQRPEP